MKVIMALKDIIDHLSIIKSIEWARIEGTSTACELGAMNKKAGIVVKAVMNEPIDGVIGTFAFFDFAHFKKILAAPGFDIPSASVKFTANGDRNGILYFDNGAGQNYTESFYGKWFVDLKEKIPPLQPWQFDAAFSPNSAGIKLLEHWHNAFKDFEFNVDAVEFINKNGNIKCVYHFGNAQRYEFPFKNSAGATFQKTWRFPTEPILAILNLYAISKSISISICELGLMKIEVDSGLAKYYYLIAARQQ